MNVGRPRKENPRTIQVNVKMTKAERQRFRIACATYDLEYADMIMKALDALEFYHGTDSNERSNSEKI